jgi:phosphate transport system permease protein
MKGKSEIFMKALLTLCALAAVGFVAVIIVYLVSSGVPAIREIGLGDFLTGRVWDPTSGDDPQYGILPMLLTSLYGAAGALLLGLPVGFLTALFLAKAAPKGVAKVLRFAVELLSGIPSVVYGLVGMLVLVPRVRDWLGLPAGDTLLAAILVLAVMILPTVISVSETALSSVPQSYEEGSLALGATRLETWLRVTAPAARSGVAAAAALGVGRALGEAMAILMVAGNAANLPGLTKSVRFLTTGIAVELGYAPEGSLHRQALFSIGLVLLVFLLVINLVLHLLRNNKLKK